MPRLSFPGVAFLLESAERAKTARVSESDTTVLYEVVTMAASQAAFAAEADSQADASGSF